MDSIIPAPLLPGDTIGIMAPSSRVDKDVLFKAQAMLEKRGYKVFIHPQSFIKLNQSAGTGVKKAAAFHDLIKRKDIKAIFCARGGNRAHTMLENLDFKLIAKNPKILLGYSDVTVLLNAIYKQTGIIGYHGPMSHGLISLPKKQVNQCFDLLSDGKLDLAMPKATILKPGNAKGKLIGGNLSLLCSLLGTKFQPDFKDAILFIEDVSEETSRTDRNLQHLRAAGALSQLKALLVGSFTDMKDTGKVKYGFTLKDCVTAATNGYKYPVLMNCPFGHGRDLFTLPLGQDAMLTIKDETARLTA